MVGRRRPGGRLRGDGRAGAVQTAVRLVSQAGRVVVVGLHDAPLRVGDLAFREIDVLGVSCCNGDEFAEAVSLSRGGQDALSGSSPTSSRSTRRSAAIDYAIRHPAEVMKAIIRLEGVTAARSTSGGRRRSRHLRADRPGLELVGPAVYVDALIAGHAAPVRDGALASIDALRRPPSRAPRRLPRRRRRPSSVRPGARDRGVLLRLRRAREGRAGAWTEIDFNSPLATRLAKDWSWLGIA